MIRFFFVLVVCVSLSACSSGRDRLESIGVSVNETLTNFKTDTGFEMINMRIVEVPQSVDLDTFFGVIPSVRDVKVLKFSGHDLSCEHVGKIAKLDGLTQLVLEACELDRSCLEQLAALQKLESFSITRFPIESNDIQLLGQFPRLRTVSLVETKVDDTIAEVLRTLPNLKNVYVSNTAVTDAFVSQVAELDSLTDLRLDGTAVTAQGLQPLIKSPGLERLHVMHLDASPIVLEVMRGAPKLKAIVLNVNEREARTLTGKVKVLPPERARERTDD